MSIHEIEDLVESSVLLLDRSEKNSSLDLRSMFWNLYRWQEGFDTKNTLFRHIDILMKHRYVYFFPVTEHQDYEKYKDYFDNLHGLKSIFRHPTEEWDEEKNPVGCYYCNTVEAWGEKFAQKMGQLGVGLYIEAGQETWKSFVERGKLNGPDAEAPVKMDIIELAEIIISLAIKNGNKELAAEWYKVGLYYQLGVFPVNVLKNNTHIQAIRKMAEKEKLMEVEVYGYNEEMAEALKSDEFGKWWFFLKD